MNNKTQIISTTAPKHYKMYKSGKIWLFVGLSALMIGSLSSFTQVSADTASKDASVVNSATAVDESTSATTSGDSTMTTDESTSATTSGDSTMTTDESTSATTSSDSTTTTDESTNATTSSDSTTTTDESTNATTSSDSTTTTDESTSATTSSDSTTTTDESTSATTSSDSITTTDESTSATTSSDSTTTTDESTSATTSSEDDASITNTSNIAFSESSTIITGNGATNIGNTVTINESGTYYVEGSSTNAQIIIDAPVTAVIKLVFNNVDLANQIGAVINGKQFGSLVVENVGTNNITSSVVIDDDDTLDIINPNGAIYADGDLTIEGSGTLNISSTMNGISADGTLTINSGTLNITKSYEALEGEIITINGGIINLNSSDDIINAQLDQTKYDAGSTDEQAININGGTLTIRGNGDGLDSNGDINITGGTIIDLIDSTPDNGALDSDGTITFTGGMIIWGGSGTEGTPEESTSTQSYVAIGSVSAGSIISITKNGEEFVNTIIPDSTTYLNISVPGIVAGETYQVTINGVSSNIVAGQGGGSGMTAEGGMGPMGTPPDGQFGQGAFPPNDGILTSGEMSSIRQNNLIKSITNTSNSTENISQNTTISANTMQDNGSISMEPKLTADDPDNKINYDSAAKTNSFEPENYVVTLNKASLATDENQQSSVNKTNATDDKKTIISSTSTLPKTGTTNSSVFASIVAILLEFGLLAGLRKKYISTKNTNLF